MVQTPSLKSITFKEKVLTRHVDAACWKQKKSRTKKRQKQKKPTNTAERKVGI